MCQLVQDRKVNKITYESMCKSKFLCQQYILMGICINLEFNISEKLIIHVKTCWY